MAVQQVVDGLEAEQDAELVLEDASQVAAVEGSDPILGPGPGFHASLEAEQFRPREE